MPRTVSVAFLKMKFYVVRQSLLISCFPMLLIMAQSRDKKISFENSSTSLQEQTSDLLDTSKENLRHSWQFPDQHDSTNISSISCSKNVSCAQRSCSDRLSFSDVLTCYCDAYCQFFQDCCYDYWSACNTSEYGKNSSEIEDDLLRPWFCVSLGDTLYWMKSKCSKSWPHDEVESLCINPPSRLNSSTYLDFFDDNITYRNRHCARCNYQSNFDFWEVRTPLN